MIESYATKTHNAHYIAQLKLNFVPKSFSMSFNIGKHKHAKEMAIYAAYLMEKTVYGTSIPGGEYETKILEILKLTSDERFMVEQRILQKLKRLLDAVNETSNEQE